MWGADLCFIIWTYFTETAFKSSQAVNCCCQKVNVNMSKCLIVISEEILAETLSTVKPEKRKNW